MAATDKEKAKLKTKHHMEGGNCSKTVMQICSNVRYFLSFGIFCN